MRADPTWTEPNERRLIVPKASSPAGRLLSDLPTRHCGRYELLGLVPHDPPIRRTRAGFQGGSKVHRTPMGIAAEPSRAETTEPEPRLGTQLRPGGRLRCRPAGFPG